ncbi:MAG TPA: hypothetical protein VGD67_27105 [Pseudonocardiaceae bacterium]
MAIVLSAGLTTACDRGADGEFVPGSYRTREGGVSVRTGDERCAANPGPAACSTVLYSLREGQRIYPICQRRGEAVATNSWWIYADAPRGHRGWVASWYLDHPTNRLPGLPTCTAALITPPRR